MAVVYQAHDTKLNRIVALKVLTCVASESAIARFARETNAASNLKHPNIVPIYSAGTSNDGRPYLVMPLINGRSLKAAINKLMLSANETARTIHAIAQALEVAHAAGLIHRDIKSANILLDDDDNQAKLADFGLVRSIDDHTLTRTEMMCGTPEYMSPEQAGSENTDARCDIYSLGITLYECLTGTLPFRGKPLDILAQHRELEPIAPTRLNQSIPRDLETICLKAMAKEPARRYQTANDLSADLHRFIEGKPISVRPIGPAGKTWRWAKRNRTVASLLSLLFLSLIAGTITSTALWLQSEKNATLAKRRSESLLASQKALTENQNQLWQTIKDTYLKKNTDIYGPYSQLPTAVRNTLLSEIVVTYRLLFERGQNDQQQLRTMANELARITNFALERAMTIRAAEITKLNTDIVDRLLDEQQPPRASDLILASRIYYQFAESRRPHVPDMAKEMWQESMLLAENAIELIPGDNQDGILDQAIILVFDSRRGLQRLQSSEDRSRAEDELLTIADEIEASAKSVAAEQDWRELKQKVFLDLARTSTGQKVVDYRNQRGKLLVEMIQSVSNDEDNLDYWLHRKHAVNQAMTGVAKAQIGKQEEARNDWEKSTRLLKQLIADSPTNAQYQADYLEIAMLLANSDWHSGNKKESLERYEDAIYQFEVLVKLNPGDPLLPRRAAQVRSLMGDHYMAINQKKQALHSYQKGIDHLQNIEIALLDKKQSQQDKNILESLQSKLADASKQTHATN